MGKRTTSRRLAMQALYEAEHSGKDIEEALQSVFSHEEFMQETRAFAEELARGAFTSSKKIDKVIAGYSKDWPVERMGGVDRNILRLAIFEIEEKKTPAQVVINEAVELTKKYSTQEAAKFVNGILGACIKKKSGA